MGDLRHHHKNCGVVGGASVIVIVPLRDPLGHMLRKKNTSSNVKHKHGWVTTYQPLSISEAIGRPEPCLFGALSLELEPGLLGTLFLELDENAWKRKMSGNRLKICNLMGRTFNEAEKAKDGKEGEDVVGVHMERCVHRLTTC